ncbi:MAG: AAA family ATPase [Mollicutes bacterium]|nr:AAA family ATPase [Mollicutes bacterium]
MNDKIFKVEEAKLKEVIEKYQEAIEECELKIKSLPKNYRDNPNLLAELMHLNRTKLEVLKRSISKPYFARIDFKGDNEKQTDKCYIGKVGLIDSDNNIIVVDWRAPIASMYYDSNIGRASYEASEGIITGELLVKRQYDIEDQKLKGFQDVDTVSNDDILKPYLGMSADHRLKNIVSTIQAEQNEIIREKLNKNIIVQGVAGSGKTTVALHRIAYLVYNNIQHIKPEQYLVIGPNKFFVTYISNVLPDLDVNNVEQLTYEELVSKYLEEEFTVNSSDQKLIDSIDGFEKFSIEKLKTSMLFKSALDKYMNDFDKTVVPKKDLIIKGYNVLPESLIYKTYESVDKQHYFNIASRVERTILLLSNYIENEYDNLVSKVNEQLYEKYSNGNLSKTELEKERKNVDYVMKELRNGCYQSLKKHFSKTNTKVLTLYSDFIKNINKYIPAKNYNWNMTNKNIKNKTLDFEDMPALLYLKYKLSGAEYFTKYRHVVIDESQDFGIFNFYALKQIMPNATFSIFGDLAQAIYSYRSINNWDQVIDTTFNNQCELKHLLKSYRTTIEIMNEANKINNHIGLNQAQPVIRHGEEINITKSDNNLEDLLFQKISNFVNKGYSSIAIICKTNDEAASLYSKLAKKGLKLEYIDSSNTEYRGGLCIITSYLAKGLEFDAVIIADASEHIYSSNKIIDMKLLYVAMTRALHELEIIYSKEITTPLNNPKLKNVVKSKGSLSNSGGK